MNTQKHQITLQDLLALAFIFSAFATVSAIDYEHEMRLEQLRQTEQVARIDFEAHP